MRVDYVEKGEVSHTISPYELVAEKVDDKMKWDVNMMQHCLNMGIGMLLVVKEELFNSAALGNKND